MDNNKIITFILVGKNDDQLEKELIDMDSVIEYGNAIILRGTTKFKMLFDNMKDDFKFRIIVHYGLKNDAKSVGKKIETALKDYKIPLEYFTREISIFKTTNQLSTLYTPPERPSSSINMYNFDEMNTEDFINQLPIRCKKEIVKSISTTALIKNKFKIFIGSSTDGFAYATAIKQVLELETKMFDIDTWKDVFGDKNDTNIEKLEETLPKYKFSIFVFSPDDTVKMSNKDDEKKIPRDNVIFEYGLFMGKNGRPNTFFVVPQNWEGLRILSDADGQNRLSYTDNENIQSAVRSSVSKILLAIKTD